MSVVLIIDGGGRSFFVDGVVIEHNGGDGGEDGHPRTDRQRVFQRTWLVFRRHYAISSSHYP